MNCKLFLLGAGLAYLAIFSCSEKLEQDLLATAENRVLSNPVTKSGDSPEFANKMLLCGDDCIYLYNHTDTLEWSFNLRQAGYNKIRFYQGQKTSEWIDENFTNNIFIDEAKQVMIDNKEYILLTASSSIAAIVEKQTNKIVWYSTACYNAHSITFIPKSESHSDSNMVAVCCVDEYKKGPDGYWTKGTLRFYHLPDQLNEVIPGQEIPDYSARKDSSSSATFKGYVCGGTRAFQRICQTNAHAVVWYPYLTPNETRSGRYGTLISGGGKYIRFFTFNTNDDVFNAYKYYNTLETTTHVRDVHDISIVDSSRIVVAGTKGVGILNINTVGDSISSWDQLHPVTKTYKIKAYNYTSQQRFYVKSEGYDSPDPAWASDRYHIMQFDPSENKYRWQQYLVKSLGGGTNLPNFRMYKARPYPTPAL